MSAGVFGMIGGAVVFVLSVVVSLTCVEIQMQHTVFNSVHSFLSSCTHITVYSYMCRWRSRCNIQFLILYTLFFHPVLTLLFTLTCADGGPDVTYKYVGSLVHTIFCVPVFILALLFIIEIYSLTFVL